MIFREKTMRKILAAVAVVFLASGLAQAQGRGASFPTAEDLKLMVQAPRVERETVADLMATPVMTV